MAASAARMTKEKPPSIAQTSSSRIRESPPTTRIIPQSVHRRTSISSTSIRAPIHTRRLSHASCKVNLLFKICWLNDTAG